LDVPFFFYCQNVIDDCIAKDIDAIGNFSLIAIGVIYPVNKKQRISAAIERKRAMSNQSKSLRPKYRIRHLFGDDRKSLLVHKRQGNIARGHMASIPEWRSRKVHAAGSFIKHNRAVTKRLAVSRACSYGRNGVLRRAEKLRPFIKGYRKQYSTQIS